MAHFEKNAGRINFFFPFFKIRSAQNLAYNTTLVPCPAYWIYAFCSIASTLKLPMQLPCDLSRCCNFLTTCNGGMNVFNSQLQNFHTTIKKNKHLRNAAYDYRPHKKHVGSSSSSETRRKKRLCVSGWGGRERGSKS